MSSVVKLVLRSRPRLICGLALLRDLGVLGGGSAPAASNLAAFIGYATKSVIDESETPLIFVRPFYESLLFASVKVRVFRG